MKDEAHLLVEILLDKNECLDARDDAAMDLGEYKDLEVLTTLVGVSSNPYENEMILDSCAESISEILVSLNLFNKDVIERVIPFAGKRIVRDVRARNPKLIDECTLHYLAKKWNVSLESLTI